VTQFSQNNSDLFVVPSANFGLLGAPVLVK